MKLKALKHNWFAHLEPQKGLFQKWFIIFKEYKNK